MRVAYAYAYIFAFFCYFVILVFACRAYLFLYMTDLNYFVLCLLIIFTSCPLVSYPFCVFVSFHVFCVILFYIWRFILTSTCCRVFLSLFYVLSPFYFLFASLFVVFAYILYALIFTIMFLRRYFNLLLNFKYNVFIPSIVKATFAVVVCICV
uniref:Uncharacterized protein n=1 Tax=Trypanosoma vivax (strain Y486) TaxID=1055687 RepID=G0U0D3_TRYVY|nr:hypothetical protein TVY486_0801400 [Trypanosoma vivax Y486]